MAARTCSPLTLASASRLALGRLARAGLGRARVRIYKVLGRPVRAEAVPRETWGALFRSQGLKDPMARIQMLDTFNDGWIEFEHLVDYRYQHHSCQHGEHHTERRRVAPEAIPWRSPRAPIKAVRVGDRTKT